MTWTIEDVRADLAIEVYGYQVEMTCDSCGATNSVLHDDRTEAPWSDADMVCGECGHVGMVEC